MTQTQTITTTTPTICVWPDSDSEPGTTTWIVSLDGLDETGGAITTDTLDVCDTRGEAIDSGRDEAARRALPLRVQAGLRTWHGR